jgi:hypothetical protein
MEELEGRHVAAGRVPGNESDLPICVAVWVYNNRVEGKVMARSKVDRRSFLKGAVTGAATLAASAGCVSAQPVAPTMPRATPWAFMSYGSAGTPERFRCYSNSSPGKPDFARMTQ